MRLYDVEKQKPIGMSVRKVLSVILAKFEVCPSRSTIARYAKHGLVIASPMKMGPTGLLSTMAYKFLCQAYLSLIQINQMNACTGDNSRKVEGYNGNVMKITLKTIEHMTCVTLPHTKDRIELLSQAKSHGNIFAATGGVHLMSNDIFMGIVLKQRKILREKLAKEKTLRQQQERTESNALAILEAAGGDATKIKGTDLTILLS